MIARNKTTAFRKKDHVYINLNTNTIISATDPTLVAAIQSGQAVTVSIYEQRRLAKRMVKKENGEVTPYFKGDEIPEELQNTVITSGSYRALVNRNKLVHRATGKVLVGDVLKLAQENGDVVTRKEYYKLKRRSSINITSLPAIDNSTLVELDGTPTTRTGAELTEALTVSHLVMRMDTWKNQQRNRLYVYSENGEAVPATLTDQELNDAIESENVVRRSVYLKHLGDDVSRMQKKRKIISNVVPEPVVKSEPGLDLLNTVVKNEATLIPQYDTSSSTITQQAIPANVISTQSTHSIGNSLRLLMWAASSVSTQVNDALDVFGVRRNII